jgi:hypothetical protein
MVPKCLPEDRLKFYIKFVLTPLYFFLYILSSFCRLKTTLKGNDLLILINYGEKKRIKKEIQQDDIIIRILPFFDVNDSFTHFFYTFYK